MQLSQFQQSYIKISQLINSSRLNESFSLIKSKILRFDSLRPEWEKILALETTYRYLLRFMIDGIEDPSRNNMLEDIREKLFRLNDLILRENLLAESSDSYSTAKRMEILKKSSFETRFNEFKEAFDADRKAAEEKNLEIAEISQSQLQALGNLFNYVWTMFGADSPEYIQIRQALLDPETPDYAKSIIIGAILLGNTHYFDPDALNLLLDIFESPQSIEVRARTIVAISLISILHSGRLAGITSIKSRLLLMKEDPEMKDLFNSIFISLIQTYDTKRITRKMREEVIPELMKIKPEIIEKMRNMASDSEDFLSDINPEWEQLFEESGIQDRLQEINDMQMEGADVMMTTFSNLKGFPFFNQVVNWFLPYIPVHPELTDLSSESNEDAFKRLGLAMCDSDIYSFLLSMKSMPEAQRGMMLNNIEQQMKQAEEVLTSAVGDTDKKKLQREIKHYLQDLYRFFKLFRKRKDFNDPFENPVTADQIRPLIDILGITAETLKIMAEFYFKYKYFEEAAGMFILLDELLPGEVGVWEKTGYCLDKLGRYTEAIEWYRKAEILKPDNQWLNKKLALCYKKAGMLKEALKYYDKALAEDPENYHLLMSAAQSLLDIGEYDEALKKFFHAEYLKPEKKAPKRAIAWTQMLAGNLDKANASFEKLTLAPDPDKADYLNAALSAMASKQFNKALNLYKSFMKLTVNNDYRELMIALKEDNSILKLLGIQTSDIRLIIDKLRYDIAES